MPSSPSGGSAGSGHWRGSTNWKRRRSPDGGLIGIVDLAYPAHRVAIEYEGEHHLTDPAQWAKDILRYERLIAAGWLPIRVTKDELFRHPDRLVTRVRAALGRS
jgi:very-short-patch-repair endonuclease